MSTVEKPKRKPRALRRNLAAERAKLVMHCGLAIEIIGEQPDTEFNKGQIAGLRGVLKMMGEVKESQA